MPQRKSLGMMAKAHVEAMGRAVALQGKALSHIQQLYSTEEVNESFDPTGLTWERFIRDLESADQSGTREQFESRLAEYLTSAITQVFSPQRQEE